MVVQAKSGEYLIDPEGMFLQPGENQPNFRVFSAQRLKTNGCRLVQCYNDTEIDVLQDRKTNHVIKLSEEGPKDKKKGKGNVKVSQPISQNSSQQSMGSTSISSLPQQQQSTQQLPDYNNMYQQDSTPLVGAATPGMESFGPMAANDAIGGSFGSAFGW
jgi:hypothetical protein